jgi:magnesium chelatase family protein
MAGEPGETCARGPKCASDYQSRLSAPLLDRFDLFVEVPGVSINDLQNIPSGEPSQKIATRVAKARDRALSRSEKQFGAKLINAQL